MGASLCSSDTTGEGNICTVACSKIDPEEEASERELEYQLANFKLDEEVDESLTKVLDDLHEAVRLFRNGDCIEAARKLSTAETAIAKSPSSKSLSELRQVSQNDPDLKDLKKLMSNTSMMASLGGSTPSTPHEDGSQEEDMGPEVRKMETRRLQGLEEDIAKVRGLCRQGRLFDAFEALQALKESLIASEKLAEGTGDTQFATVIEILENKLKQDPMLMKLLTLQPKMQEAVNLLRSPADSRGVSLSVKDPILGEDFTLDIQIRFAEGSERVKGGPSTQLVVRGDMRNLPTSLINCIVENCETDLFRKEWMQDCTQVSGKPGRPARLYSSFVHASISPPLLPIRVEEVLLREFAVCPGEGALPERGPGVVVYEHRPPDGAKEFEGFAIPPKRRGVIRLSGGMTAFYKSRGKAANTTNIVAVSLMGLPVPQAILPLSLLKRFAADLFLNSLKKMKVGLYDAWDQLEYRDRVAGLPDFYELVQSLPPDNL